MNFDLAYWWAKQRFLAGRIEFFEDVAEVWRNADFKAVLLRRRQRAAERRDGRAEVYARMYRSVEGGASFLQAVGEFMTPTNRMIVSAYEPTGQIDVGLSMAAKVDRQVRRINAMVLQAGAYPVGVLVALCLVMAFFSTKVFPSFSAIKPLATWPWWAQLFIATGQFIAHFGGYLAIGGVAAVVLWFMTFPRHVGARRRWLDQAFFPYRMYLRYQSTVFLVILAAQMQAPGSMADALRRIGRQSNPWLRMYSDVMIDRLLRPTMHGIKTPLQALDAGLLHPDVVDRLELLAESGRTKPEEAISAIGLDLSGTFIQRVGVGVGAARSLSFVALGVLILWLLATLSVPMEAAFELINNSYGSGPRMR